MPQGQGSSKGRYLFEMDGITSIRASRVQGLDVIKHTPVKFYEGNKPNANLVRGNYEVGEITVQQAEALNQTGSEFFRWIQDFVRGVNTERRGARLVVLDEDGVTPVAEYELIDCVPTSLKVEDQEAGSNDANMFTFGLQPEDCIRY